MNIAQTANETTAAKTTTTTVYVNIQYGALATAMNNNDGMTPQFTGKGRKVVLIPEDQESKYVSYSSNSAGTDIMPQPFVINNGDNIKFKLQAAPGDSSGATSTKWKDIIQDRYDLQLVSGKKSTYNANISDGAESENDNVIINITFKVDGVKFAAAWDPRFRIKK